ncbi:hypothetical protein E2I00_018695 [Balaenoptera physalus]|uniref:Uncharacterized protein n=1 Tax=Balaenoptera physalus TaxID=9770 RepID=A0A643BRW6_BALPH|nr:hypothetical protein E2I00_018695 [Balaenoptera physalus]
MDRWNRECMALILQVWRKELELKPPKTMAVSRTTKSPPKGSSGTKPTRHSVLKQIYAIPGQNWFHEVSWYLNRERLKAKRLSAGLHE